MDAYRQTVAALYQRMPQRLKLGLEPIRALLKALGHPERCMRCIVVAGTNGKGSTSTLIAQALQHAGHRVGLYTSPHLLRFTERIRISGAEINPQAVPSLYQQVIAVAHACPRSPSFFECTTAMALLAFAQAQVTVAVLEVGVGGRWDATNAVDKELAVLTPIDLDHQDLLGNTLEAISTEKAGIIAPHRPVVSAPQPPQAWNVIQHVAKQRHAPLTLVPVPTSFLPAQAPPYQHTNASTAAAACGVLDAQGLTCPPGAFQAAADAFFWPGRYQWISSHPPTLLDGAHNPAGIRALLAALHTDPRTAQRPLHGVFSALRTKDAQGMLALLRPAVHRLYLCPVTSARSRTQQELTQLAWPGEQVHPHLPAALQAAQHAAGSDGAVVVTGSLFLVADALAYAEQAPRDPPVDG